MDRLGSCTVAGAYAGAIRWRFSVSYRFLRGYYKVSRAAASSVICFVVNKLGVYLAGVLISAVNHSRMRVKCYICTELQVATKTEFQPISPVESSIPIYMISVRLSLLFTCGY